VGGHARLQDRKRLVRLVLLQVVGSRLPMTLTRADGSAYSLFVMYEERGDGFLEIRCQAEQQNDDGISRRFPSVEQDRQFLDGNHLPTVERHSLWGRPRHRG